MSSERDKLVVKLYESGIGTATIAREIGMSREGVRGILLRLQHPRRPMSKAIRLARARQTQAAPSPLLVAEQEITALRARVAALEAALQPFARAGEKVSGPDKWGAWTHSSNDPDDCVGFTVGDLRRAAAAMESAQQEAAGGEGEGLESTGIPYRQSR